jgi:hypothetical protein
LKTKKYIVLGVLFILPITVYLFFATGVNNFVKLPVLTEKVEDISSFQSSDGSPLTFENHITVLGFFGNDVASKKANAFNLAHKIYKKNHQFEDFQFVILVTEDQIKQVSSLKEELSQIADPTRYKFAYASTEMINSIFQSLKTDGVLNGSFATNLVYIIDKEGNLRGRKDDKEAGILFGFDASNYAEVNNKMSDDVKILLAEYRLALKKYNSNRKI